VALIATPVFLLVGGWFDLTSCQIICVERNLGRQRALHDPAPLTRHAVRCLPNGSEDHVELRWLETFSDVGKPRLSGALSVPAKAIATRPWGHTIVQHLGTRESPKALGCYGIGAHQPIDVHGRKL
jgi:hypothetical protein